MEILLGVMLSASTSRRACMPFQLGSDIPILILAACVQSHYLDLLQIGSNM